MILYKIVSLNSKFNISEYNLLKKIEFNDWPVVLSGTFYKYNNLVRSSYVDIEGADDHILTLRDLEKWIDVAADYHSRDVNRSDNLIRGGQYIFGRLPKEYQMMLRNCFSSSLSQVGQTKTAFSFPTFKNYKSKNIKFLDFTTVKENVSVHHSINPDVKYFGTVDATSNLKGFLGAKWTPELEKQINLKARKMIASAQSVSKKPLRVRLTQEGCSFIEDENIFCIGVAEIMHYSAEEIEFLPIHEAGHCDITRTVDKWILESDPKRMLHNVIEDGRVNLWEMKRFPATVDMCNKYYNLTYPKEDYRAYNEPRLPFEQFCYALMYYWIHDRVLPKIDDKDVRLSLQKSAPFVDEIFNLIPWGRIRIKKERFALTRKCVDLVQEELPFEYKKYGRSYFNKAFLYFFNHGTYQEKIYQDKKLRGFFNKIEAYYMKKYKKPIKDNYGQYMEASEEAKILLAKRQMQIIKNDIWPLFEKLVIKSFNIVQKKQAQNLKNQESNLNNASASTDKNKGTGKVPNQEKGDSSQLSNEETSNQSNASSSKDKKKGSGQVPNQEKVDNSQLSNEETSNQSNASSSKDKKKGSGQVPNQEKVDSSQLGGKEIKTTHKNKNGGANQQFPGQNVLSLPKEPSGLSKMKQSLNPEAIKRIIDKIAKEFADKLQSKAMPSLKDQIEKQEKKKEQKRKLRNNRKKLKRNLLETLARNVSGTNKLIVKNPYSTCLSKVKKQATQLTNRLTHTFVPNTEPWWQGYFSSGKLSVPRLIKVMLSGTLNAKLFLKKTKPEARDYRFSIVIDQSGSMKGTLEKKAMESLAVFIETLNHLKLKYNVIGFSNTATVYKKFGDKLSTINKKAQLFENLEDGFSKGQMTNDTEALSVSLESIKNDLGESNFIIVLTDGEGNVNTKGLSMKSLQQEAKKNNIGVVGVGIGEGVDAVAKTYEHYVQEPNIGNLPRSLGKLLERLLLRSV